MTETLTDPKTKHMEQWFSSIDLKYADSQLRLHPDTMKHCIFNMVGGNTRGTYRFKPGFYELADMPAEF